MRVFWTTDPARRDPWFGILLGVVATLFGCKDPRSKAELVRDPAGDMVALPEATVKLGRENDSLRINPLRTVTVGPVAIDVTEVTVAAYQRCVLGGTCSEPGGASSYAPGSREKCNWGMAGKENHPVNCVDFDQAVAFCRWAGKRLPTDDEWEYAARGTDGRAYPWGNDPPKGQLCWKRKASKQGTCAVGSHPAGAGAYGDHALQNLAGNVYEWTEFGEIEPFMMVRSGASRLVRGGSWQSEQASGVNTTGRGGRIRTFQGSDTGFRCAR